MGSYNSAPIFHTVVCSTTQHTAKRGGEGRCSRCCTVWSSHRAAPPLRVVHMVSHRHGHKGIASQPPRSETSRWWHRAEHSRGRRYATTQRFVLRGAEPKRTVAQTEAQPQGMPVLYHCCYSACRSASMFCCVCSTSVRNCSIAWSSDEAGSWAYTFLPLGIMREPAMEAMAVIMGWNATS